MVQFGLAYKYKTDKPENSGSRVENITWNGIFTFVPILMPMHFYSIRVDDVWGHNIVIPFGLTSKTDRPVKDMLP